MQRSTLLCTLLLLLGAGPAGALNITWDGHADGKHHEYQVVAGNLTWADAADNLALLPEDTVAPEAEWYLATVTSAAEQAFLQGDVLSGKAGEFWLGGMQAADYTGFYNATLGWSWVTSETWDFTHWQTDEPNEWGGNLEDRLGIWGGDNTGWGWHWNDEHGKANIAGYVAERAYLVNPEPGTLLLLGSGLLGMASRLRRRLRSSS